LHSETRKETWGTHLRELRPREVYDLYEGDTRLARLILVQTEGGGAMPATMVRGDIDVGLGGTAAIARFADNGHPIRIVAPLQADGDQLVMRKGSEITDWESFVQAARTAERPIRIGYKEPMAVAKLVFERGMQAENIAYGYEMRPGLGVTLVNFASEASPLPLLASGALDGVVMNQPGTAMAVHRGAAQVVAELRDLPPEGKWHNHPCCVLGATQATIDNHPEALKGLIRVLMLASQLINDDLDVAVETSVRWIRNPNEVASMSIPTSSHIVGPDPVWMQGMKNWLQMARDVEFFKGKYATISEEAFLDDLLFLDFVIQNEAILRERGLIGQP